MAVLSLPFSVIKSFAVSGIPTAGSDFPDSGKFYYGSIRGAALVDGEIVESPISIKGEDIFDSGSILRLNLVSTDSGEIIWTSEFKNGGSLNISLIRHKF